MTPLQKKIFRILFFIILLSYHSCTSITELYIIRDNNKWGYINRYGNQVIAPEYDYCCIERQEDTCCSRIIWPDGIGIVKKNNKYGAIDPTGNIKINFQFDYLDQYHNSFVIAKSAGKYAVLNANGDTLFPFIFDNQFISCGNKIGHGQIEGKLYLLNFENKSKLPTSFSKISYFVEGKSAVLKDQKYGFINEQGREIITPAFQEVWPFNRGLAAAKMNFEWGFIDTSGCFIIEPQYDETQGFDILNPEIAVVVKNKKYGIIDRTGKLLIQPKYEYLYIEDDNVLHASIIENNRLKTGLINLKEKWLYVSLDKYFEYFNGYLKLNKNNKFGLIKLRGNKTILPCIYDEIAFRTKGLTMVVIYNKKTGVEFFAYVNKHGKLIWKEDGFKDEL
ncbi:MAG: WG repeat-containing protein [Bacteroidales bacterium]|nr:WG repeat-containing protein [Bacteroidales bacterium]